MHRSHSFKKVQRVTSSKRTVTHYRRGKDMMPHCAICGQELNQLVKSNAPKEEIAKKQSELMPLISENMKTSIRPMLVILPVFFLLYYLILPTTFHSIANEYVPFIDSMKLNYLGVFFACVFILGIATSIIIMIYDRKKTKLERQAIAAAEAAESGTNT